MKTKSLFLLFVLVAPFSIAGAVAGQAPAAVGSSYQFTEGPAADGKGNVFFTDVRANRIYKWSAADGKAVLWRENTAGANGLFFDGNGNLIACEGENGRIVSIAADGKLSVVADRYNGKRFNKPNDLWVDSKGGVYFSDPCYGQTPLSQDGEHVYYVAPDRKKVTRVCDDLKKPNGLIGTPDGKTLRVCQEISVADRAGISFVFKARIADYTAVSGAIRNAEDGRKNKRGAIVIS